MAVQLAERADRLPPRCPRRADRRLMRACLPDGQAVERPLIAGLLTMGDEAVDAVAAHRLPARALLSQVLGAVYGTMLRLRGEHRAVTWRRSPASCAAPWVPWAICPPGGSTPSSWSCHPPATTRSGNW